MHCPNCGNQVEDRSRFCGFCGYRFGDAQSQVVEDDEPTIAYDHDDNDVFFVQEDAVAYPNPYPQPVQKSGGVKLPIKWIALGAGVLVVLIAVILVIGLFAGGSEVGYGLYLKDEQLFFSDLSGDPVQISDKLMHGYDDLDNEDLADASYAIARFVDVSEDGSRIFFPDRIDPDDGSSEGFTLYYRNPNKPRQEPEKLDSGVTQYYVSASGNKVVYLKGDSLYVHDLKEREKIAGGVKGFWTEENASVIYYIDDDDTLYVKDGTADKEKIDRDVSNLDYLDVKDGLIIYSKEDAYYRYELGKEKEKLVSGDGYILDFAENGNFFYVEYMDYPLLDFIDYDAEQENWAADLEELTVSLRALYYFEGTEKTLVADNINTLKSSVNGLSNAVIFCKTDPDDAGKINMSDIVEEYYDSLYSFSVVARDMVEDLLAENVTTHLAVETKISDMKYEDVKTMQISEDGKTMYFLADFDSDDYCGTLYKASISGGKLGKVEELDDEVYDSYWYNYIYMGVLAYYKDVDDGMGDLYIDGEEVDYEVLTGSLMFVEDGKDYYYVSDWDDGRDEGILKHYDGGKPEAVAEDVHSAVLALTGEVLYLQDYSTKSYKGDLYCYNGRKAVMLDEDVVSLLNLYDAYHYASNP